MDDTLAALSISFLLPIYKEYHIALSKLYLRRMKEEPRSHRSLPQYSPQSCEKGGKKRKSRDSKIVADHQQYNFLTGVHVPDDASLAHAFVVREGSRGGSLNYDICQPQGVRRENADYSGFFVVPAVRAHQCLVKNHSWPPTMTRRMREGKFGPKSLPVIVSMRPPPVGIREG